MSISRTESNLRIRLFRVPASTALTRIAETLGAQERPSAWTVLVDLADGELGVITSFDLSEEVLARDSAASRSAGDLAQPSPQVEAAEADMEQLRKAGSPTGYVVVMRDGEPLGVVMTKRGRGGLLSIEQGSSGQGSSLRPVTQREDRYVNTDFASPDAADAPLARSAALRPGATYLVRVHVGERERSSIEEQATQLPTQLLDRDLELDVVLFSEDMQVRTPHGRLRVPASGTATVLQRAASPAGLGEALLSERLLFEVVAPERPGIANLRCSLYYQGMLIQSRLISAAVGEGQMLDSRGTLRKAVLDFNLSSSLAPEVLAGVAPHKLSLMLNETGGSHQFRVVAGDGKELFSASATLSPTELGNLIMLGRERLRQTAWGKTTEWSNEDYRYEARHGNDELLKRMREDLIGLARRGAVLYNTAVRELVGGAAGLRELRALMKTPGVVQFACKQSANDLVPVALFYDHKIDSQSTSLTLCPAFEASLASGRPLIDEPCFKGDCPSSGDLNVVCPSGFWGFRHDIGMPYPVRPRGPELATTIAHSGQPLLDIAYYSDFPGIAPHLERLGALGFNVQKATARGDVLKLFQQSKPQLIYFYCHGVEVNTMPFLRVGGSAANDYISSDNLANYEIAWPDERPLVFINGCHTAALTPDHAISLVATFVDDASASGVIGTDITIFEPLAQRFAETFLPLFRSGVPFGRAIRMARLDLLAARNPLGLAYLPLAYAGLTLNA